MTEKEMERESVNKTLKGELTKLKEMTFSEKVEYIWDYYKIPILIVICAILLIGSLVNHYINRKDDVLFGIIVDAHCDVANELTEDLNQFIGVGPKETVFVEPNLYLKSSPNFETETKITCYIAAGTIDYAFGDFAMMENFGKNGILKDLTKLLPKELLDYFGDDIVTYNFSNSETGETFTGNYLKLNDYVFFEKYGFVLKKEGDSFYLCIAAVSPNPDNTIKLFEYIKSLGKK